MTDLKLLNPPAPALTKTIRTAALALVRSRRGLIALAVLLLALGLAFNWSLLVAVGAAPLILSVLPCAVMCGLGLCMAHGSHHSADALARTNEAAVDATVEAERSCCSQAKARSK